MCLGRAATTRARSRATRDPPAATRARSRRAACSVRRKDRSRPGSAARAPRTWFGGPARPSSIRPAVDGSRTRRAPSPCDSASSSARAHSASFLAWLMAQTSLRCARSSLRRVKNLSHASRKRFQTTRVSGRGTGPIACHSSLELLHLVCGLDPVGRVGERFGADAERELLLEVRLALYGPRGEELARLRLDGIGCLTIAMPQRLRLGARRFGRLLPALLDVVQLARGLLESSGFSRSYFLRSASACAINSSWTAALANRFHSSISRSSWSFGASVLSAAFRRSTS